MLELVDDFFVCVIVFDDFADLVAAMDAFETGECLVWIECDRAKAVVAVVPSICIEVDDLVIRIQSLFDESVEPTVTTQDDVLVVSVGGLFQCGKNRPLTFCQ